MVSYLAKIEESLNIVGVLNYRDHWMDSEKIYLHFQRDCNKLDILKTLVTRNY